MNHLYDMYQFGVLTCLYIKHLILKSGESLFIICPQKIYEKVRRILYIK